MESLVNWYQGTLGGFLPKEVFVFIVSMLPVIELRGGLVAASLLQIPLLKANVICILGNVLPVPFILLFIKRIFRFLHDHHLAERFVSRLERRAMRKSTGMERGEFVFLVLFTGIPLPGTGAWTGSIIAALLNVDIKKATLAEVLGVLIAAVIMDIVSYGLLANLVG